MHDDQDFRKTCLLHLLLNPLTLGALLFGALCIGESIVNYFHAREAVTLLGIFFLSLVIGFLAALILFGILHACWLNSYVEREVKQEFRERFCYTIFGCVLVLCTLITFFGCFGEVVGKTWDNMDIGVRNDECASTETPKTEKAQTKNSPSDALRDESIHDSMYTMEQEEARHTAPAAFSTVLEQQRLAHDPLFRVSHTDTPSHPLDDDFFLPRTRRKRTITNGHHAQPDTERITDSDCECADGCEQEDFWITEEDDTTHNSSCARYGKGEGMYAVQGSGTDCPDCAGANGVSQTREVPADKENAQTKTDESSSASTSQHAPDKLVYWVSLNDGLIHHPSCSQYCKGRGYYTTTPTAKDCPQCGGRRQMYWITDVNGKTHKWPCTWFGKYKGHYSTEGTGHNCQECGGAR